MLVTLGTNQAISAGASAVFTYSPSSVQKIFIKVDDDAGTTAYDHTINVQLGSITLVNSASAYGMLGMSMMQGGWITTSASNECVYAVNLGSHQALTNQQLYVTITAGAGALDGVDVSALINGSGNQPVRYTEYTNSTFAQENCLSAIGYGAVGVAVDEVTDTCEIRTNISASSPTFASGSNWFQNSGQVNGYYDEFYSRLLDNPVPMNTSFNYTSSTVERILCASAMGSTQQDRSQARRTAQIQRSAIGK
jgi:hypothetical protein